MKRLVFLLGIVLLAGCAEELTCPEDGFEIQAELIADRVARISPERLMGRVEALTSIHSRYMHYDEGCSEALNLIHDWLQEEGATAVWDSFSFVRLREIETANIYADFPGTVAPERRILVGAHWDSYGNNHWWYDEDEVPHHDSSTVAPGAVDNATGVAAVMELARVLRDTPTAYTVRLAFFAAEEIGFKGSKRFAEFWDEEEGPDSLVCMVNVDMVGWDGDAPDISLIGVGSTLATANQSLLLADELSPHADLSVVDADTLAGGWPASDQYRFWLEGLPALMLTEGPHDWYPHANSAQDSFSEVMPDMLEAGTQALVATVLQLAQPQLP